MSIAVKVPYTILYKSPEAKPPVFLAGTFTNPPWVEQEMEPAMDEDDGPAFKATVLVEQMKIYQFQFKIGREGTWFFDERKPIAEDHQGMRTNWLSVPLNHHSRRFSEITLAVGDDGSLALDANMAQLRESYRYMAAAGADQDRSTPIEQVAATAADVADTAEKLDSDEASPPQASASGSESELEEDLKTPLFAHECFGAYAFVDDGSEQDSSFESQSKRDSQTKSADHSVNQLDLDDPTLERFPSERSSVLDALRKIQSSRGEDQVHFDDPASRRTSVDSSDDGALSPGTLSPSTTRRRDNRLSAGNARKRSVASLGSIAEEPKPGSSEQRDIQHT